MKRFVRPISKKFGVLGLVLTVLLTIVLIVANVALNRYSSTISSTLDLNAQIADGGDDEVYQSARDITQEIAGEGATLLKNENGSLPLDTNQVNVFGYASVNLVYGGSGSGSTSGASYNDTLKESFEAEGLEINEDLWDFYTEKSQDSASWNVFSPNGGDYNIYDANCTEVLDMMDSAREYSDTAVVIFSRAGGEGGDLPMDMGVTDEETGAGLVGGDAGKSYLELQDVELELLDAVEENFDNVIVLINSSHAMELGFLEDDGVDAALQIAGPGATGMRGVADILLGETNPSGHLVDTYAYDVKSAPSYYNMGDCTYSDYEQEMSDSYFYYEENIYTGYRWYETAAAENAVVTAADGTVYDYADYDSIVQYPFGYGLSYTTFDWDLADYRVDGQGGEVTATVTVTNTGDVAGKDVVQLYYSAPYIEGGIEKSAVNLGAFAKTDLLEPGESQDVELTMTFDDMASFDWDGVGAYVMDTGTYTFTLRTDSHTVKNDGGTFTYELADTIIYNDENDGKRSTDEVAAVSQQEFADAGTLETNMTYLSRADFAGTFPKVERRLNPTEIPDEVRARLEANGPGSTVLETVDTDVDTPVTDADNGLSVDDLAGVDYDDEQWDLLVQQMSVDELIELTGNAGWQTSAIESVGKKATTDIDGPQGLNGFNFSGTKMNSYASEVLMGMTWNCDLVNEMGSIYAQEALSWGVVGLYAPAMNTHRSPFGGRNFEYFAEDPTLAGLLAAAEVGGMQGEGVYVYAKHYLLNTQDTNRDGAANWCNEQALREIYARPFELAIKLADCTGLMTELSRIGTSWSSATYALCTEMPREEWGFTGKIITDGVGPGGDYYMLPDYAIAAGNDMMLTRASGDCGYTDITLDSDYGIAQMQKAAKNILYVYANSKASEVSGMYDVNWEWAWVAGDIVLVALAVLLFVALPVRAWCVPAKNNTERSGR
ncbi:beta-glucosidase [Bifidobacterium phasiani]|uniref:Glycoside hydrolase family 3 C-terminal domain-containing protein n=1 Tax=Bifidobacterium phasiani TaxID=2834431 RepID=A0ABS6W931_9BIFI|nr:glycoside hydrolase family 3 C-terminal domain-containing protein [Bifidobacterium phasiani]MBW3082247.1 glycoside hydrolase family 3 C-terminal domain-containing protein [Bifidobacterium phasiani]